MGNKKITVKNPWSGSHKTFEYILISDTSKLDTSFGATPVIKTPVKKIIPLSTVCLPLLDSLGAVDDIVAVADWHHVNNLRVNEKIKSGIRRYTRKNKEFAKRWETLQGRRKITEPFQQPVKD